LLNNILGKEKSLVTISSRLLSVLKIIEAAFESAGPGEESQKKTGAGNF